MNQVPVALAALDAAPPPQRILFLSHTYWDSIFRVGSHHLAAQMSGAGHQVYYLSTPISPLHWLKRRQLEDRIARAGKLQQVRPNLTALVPLTPLPAGLLMARGHDPAFGTLGVHRSALATIVREPFDLIFVDDPKFAGLLRHLSWRRLIYRPTDLYSQMGMRNWQNLEGHLLERCDRVIATSGPVATFLQNHFQTRQPVCIEINGVDDALFTADHPCPSEYLGSDRRRGVYVGAIDFRFDFDALTQLAGKNPDMAFYIIGPQAIPIPAHVRTLGNLHFLGPRNYATIPAYLQHADIGLLLLKPLAVNDGRSPMKVYEYLAAGLPVVSLETPELARRNIARVFRYRDGETLQSAFVSALRSPRSPYIEPKLHWQAIAARLVACALQ